MSELSAKDQERLDAITATYDNGAWTQYHDSEPMVGFVRLGATEHAVFESRPLEGGNFCTRRTLCGQHRSSVVSRATKRAFDADMPRVGKPCAICLRLIARFREWQASRAVVASGEVGNQK